ncbi:DUF262 domain-containing protein [Elizabethkingia meningoseptica]|uniref:DUF262 domain-containing protein n=1 Tax=Elizabethkingia meningoseptica TaxID=238 RepID=UPI0020136CA3|nr:DUF262 domain-containing protein [Elizabethkingia meningoseptica]MCL1674307.1 DUF262 domain-containing protein [Elizabethkingia meningoseptica]MCL1686072.1 DUF262 domain-containing protein [Elizabethkingia meningoseptica]
MGALEARFTIIGSRSETLFTIVEESDSSVFLYSSTDDREYKIPLTNNSGLLSLSSSNPFEESLEVVEERLIGLSSDWVENRSQGFENSTDFNQSGQPGYGPEDIFVENKPFSLRQILDLIGTGDIELTPDFQRNFIWDRTRQSKLIESILLGLPLPSIYLSQYEDGRLTVVDGLQRLSTIKSFLNDQLTLTNLEYLTECNGLKYSELSQTLSMLRLRRFTQTQIMCFVIDYRSPSKLKFDLFRRLNTGGKPLNNQEIRNCLSRPEIQYLLKDMVNLQSFRDATNYSVKDTRMDAREAALRFLYFIEQYSPDQPNPTGDYNGDMEGTLDDFIDELNSRNIGSLREYITIYERGLKNAYHVFGDYCFRKVTPETYQGRRTPVNKLLMLSFSVLLSKYDHSSVLRVCDFAALVEPLAYFIGENEEVFRAITWGTNGKWNLTTCFNHFEQFLTDKLGHAEDSI